MPKIKPIVGIAVFLLFSFACNALVTPTAVPEATPSAEFLFTPTAGTIPLTENDVPRITPEDAKAAFDSNAAIFIDVRSKDAFIRSRVPGAYLIQFEKFETDITKINLPKDKWYITYCT